MFSKRFDYNIEDNNLSKLLKEKKSAGVKILDLTESNPTNAGFNYNEIGILNSIAKPESMRYSPNPKGLESAREAVSQYYKEKNINVDLENIFLSSSTSEAYSFIFKLLTNPFDEVLIPRPSYPLFSFIAEMESINLKYYNLIYTENKIWEIDFDSINSQLTENTKAIILVNPNNPTGNFIKLKEINLLLRICKENNIALICDEVFMDYILEAERNNTFSFAGINYVLTFTLSGLSKICGLPQMKLSWIVISGPTKECEEATAKLEIITDTYLSVGTPVQLAANNLLIGKEFIQTQIKERIIKNYNYIKSESKRKSYLELLKTEGGWYTVLNIKKLISEEIIAFELLDKKDVYIHPGYFFDFKEEVYIVVSLLTPEEKFKEGIIRILEHLELSINS
ncbi:MAG: pyridoxal phosphate-dependent aminotransferase [Ignavibacteriae bacterium]|nr:pyridoxal phosphate-dependent aminotransferase [Ignavibacteriota bacterium]